MDKEFLATEKDLNKLKTSIENLQNDVGNIETVLSSIVEVTE